MSIQTQWICLFYKATNDILYRSFKATMLVHQILSQPQSKCPPK